MSDRSQEVWVLRLLRRHPALLVSALYVVASTIGMLFAWRFLGHFGLNVFNYSQIGDFLLASLKEPMTWALVAFALLLVVVDNRFSRLWQQKAKGKWTRWYGSRRYRAINNLVAVVLVVIFIDSYAAYKARQVHEGNGKVVEYVLADSQSRRAATLLGTTAQFVFLFDVTTQKVFVVPHESLKMITFQAPERELRAD